MTLLFVISNPTEGKGEKSNCKAEVPMKRNTTIHKVAGFAVTAVFATALITAMLLATGLSSVRAEEQTISERVMHYRAIDSVVWAMPLLNFKTYRDGHKAIGCKYNDICYFSRM